MPLPSNDFFQQWLDDWSSPFLADDFERFMALVNLPFTVRSNGSEWVNARYEECKPGFDSYRDLLRGHGVDMIVRVLRDCIELSDGHVRLTYENYLMNGAQRMFRPSGAEAYLRLHEDGIWRAYRVHEIIFDDVDSNLPATRADLLHDKAMVERLTVLRDADEQTKTEENND